MRRTTIVRRWESGFEEWLTNCRSILSKRFGTSANGHETFLDTTLFVAAVTDEPEVGAIAADLLSTDHELLTSTLNHANQLQQETLLYPLDCLILACAQSHDADLVSFDSELQDNGAHSPREVLR